MHRTALALALSLVALTPPALAAPDRPGPRGPGPMAGPMAGRGYDPATVQTVAGEVAEVRRLDGPRGGGVHLTLTTAAGPLDVHLGPAWFVDQQALRPAKGDRVEVTGSRVTIDGQPALIARLVKRGDAALTLRDEAGVPAWAGGPRR